MGEVPLKTAGTLTLSCTLKAPPRPCSLGGLPLPALAQRPMTQARAGPETQLSTGSPARLGENSPRSGRKPQRPALAFSQEAAPPAPRFLAQGRCQGLGQQCSEAAPGRSGLWERPGLLAPKEGGKEGERGGGRQRLGPGLPVLLPRFPLHNAGERETGAGLPTPVTAMS